jgi:hypothetical protein
MALYDGAVQQMPADPLALPNDALSPVGIRVAQAPIIRPEIIDKPQWWKDPKLDWNTVPLGQIHRFEVPEELRHERDRGLQTMDADLFKRYNDYIERLIRENGLQPGDGFILEGQTYQYLGPDVPGTAPGHDFIPKPPSPKPEIG